MTHTAVHPGPSRAVASRAAQALSWLAVVAFGTFVVVVVVAGLGVPHYDAVADGIGGLGARNSSEAGLMNVGFVVLSVAMVAAGAVLLPHLRGKSGLGASMLVVVSGVAVSMLAVAQQDCSTAQPQCVTAGLANDLSTAHTVHRALAVGIVLALVVSMWMAVVSLRGQVGAQTLSTMMSVATIASTFVFIWYGSELYSGIGGAVERLMTLLVFGWPVLLAVALSRTRATPSSRGTRRI
jgi:hypothetical membrane protein